MDKKSMPTFIQIAKKIKEEVSDPKEQGRLFSASLAMKFRNERIPMNGRFELTPKCNLDCKMCYINMNNLPVTDIKMMSTEIWKELADEAKANGMLCVSLTGGECLTYPGFDELYRYLFQKGIMIEILSNGILMDSERIQFFQQFPPQVIKISLYGGSENEYEQVTGYMVYEKVIRNIQALCKAGLPVCITITPNPFTKEDPNRIWECVEALDIPVFINSALILPRENTGRREAFDICSEPFIKICKVQCDRKKVKLKTVDNEKMPAPGQDNGGIKRGLLCGAGKTTFTIQYDGKMCPCSGLEEITTNPLKDGFRNAWEELKEKTEALLRPVECDNCAYKPRCSSCPAIHKAAPQGHCDRRICERTMQMIREGMWKPPADWNSYIRNRTYE